MHSGQHQPGGVNSAAMRCVSKVQMANASIEDLPDPISLFDGKRTPIVAPKGVAVLM